MDGIKRICELVEKELRNIGEKGITNGNLENLYKLVDIAKDCKEIEYKGSVLDEMQGYSEDYSGNYSGARGGQHSMTGMGNNGSRGGYSGNMYGDDGSSYARGRRNQPRNRYGQYRRDYSRSAWDDYSEAKESYRSSKDDHAKDDMMNYIREYTGEITDKLQEMYRDADTQEERQEIQRAMDKLRQIR